MKQERLNRKRIAEPLLGVMVILMLLLNFSVNNAEGLSVEDTIEIMDEQPSEDDRETEEEDALHTSEYRFSQIWLKATQPTPQAKTFNHPSFKEIQCPPPERV